MLSLDQIVILARTHASLMPERNAGRQHMESSARLCLSDAVTLKNDGKYIEAARRALKSLEYSVGQFHHDYKRVKTAVDAHPWVLQS